jgi:hypothetical protein
LAPVLEHAGSSFVRQRSEAIDLGHEHRELGAEARVRLHLSRVNVPIRCRPVSRSSRLLGDVVPGVGRGDLECMTRRTVAEIPQLANTSLFRRRQPVADQSRRGADLGGSALNEESDLLPIAPSAILEEVESSGSDPLSERRHSVGLLGHPGPAKWQLSGEA